MGGGTGATPPVGQTAAAAGTPGGPSAWTSGKEISGKVCDDPHTGGVRTATPLFVFFFLVTIILESINS